MADELDLTNFLSSDASDAYKTNVPLMLQGSDAGGAPDPLAFINLDYATATSPHNIVATLDQAFKKLLELPSLRMFPVAPPAKPKPNLDSFLIRKGDLLNTLASNESGYMEAPESKYDYIRWDLLVEIINNFVMECNQTDQIVSYSYRGNPQSVDDVDKEENLLANKYLEYSNYNFNPKTTIYFNSDWQGNAVADTDIESEENEDGEEISGATVSADLASLVDGSLNPEICLLPHQVESALVKFTGQDMLVGETKFIYKDLEGNDSGTPTATNKSIGLIWIGIDYLLAKYKGMRFDEKGGDKEDWSLFKFFKDVWENDITGACAGTHKFILHCPNNIVSVIDMSYSSDLVPEELFTFNIQDKNSIVRDFNFNTTIDKKLSSTISIAAQAPKSIQNLDQLSFAAFNKNIKNRFVVLEEPDEDKLLKNRQKLEKDANKIAAQLYNHKRNMIGGEEESNKQTISNAVNKAQDLERKILELTMTYSETETDLIEKDRARYNDKLYVGSRKIDFKMPKSSIIPLKFSAKMDGIGGIVIGNIFRLQQSKLPEGYRGRDVAFAVTSINHKITKGQDWITEIGGQLILLDLQPEGDEGSTGFTLGSMGMTSGEAADYAAVAVQMGTLDAYGRSVYGRNPMGVTDDSGDFAKSQGVEADFWTLVAIVATEAYHHGVGATGGGDITAYQQDCCDIAQSIFNRYEVDQVELRTIKFGDIQGHSDHTGGQNTGPTYKQSYYAATSVGDSFKSMLVTPCTVYYDLEGVAHDGGNHKGCAAYEVTYEAQGKHTGGPNNDAWCAIINRKTALNAMHSYYNSRNMPTNDILLDRRMNLILEGFLNKTLMDNSRALIEGRTDYRGTGITMQSMKDNISTILLPTELGGNNPEVTAKDLEPAVRNLSTGNKFVYGNNFINTFNHQGTLVAAPIPYTLTGYFN